MTEQGGAGTLELSELLSLAASIGTIVAAVAVCITILFVWRQTSIQASSHVNEIRTFKRESTVFLTGFLNDPKFREGRELLLHREKLGQKLPLDAKELDQFRYVLNTYEMLSQATLDEFMAEEVWKNFWRDTLLRDWGRLDEFVEKEREHWDDDVYRDTEKIVKRWTGV